MGRKILFTTADRRRRDTLGCSGGSEGALYNRRDDRHQWRDLGRDLGRDLDPDLYEHLPATRAPRLLVDAPA